MDDIIIGRNSVKAAVKSDMKPDKIYIAEGITDGSIREVIKIAKQSSIPIKEIPKKKIDEMCRGLGYGDKPANHQGIIAQIPAIKYAEIDDIFINAKNMGQSPFIIIADGIQDPHNLGAIIRSAEVFGAHGVIISKHRASPLNASAFKASAGAASYIPIVKVTNINQTINLLKQKGLWIAAANTDGKPAYLTDLSGPLAIIIGSEGDGIPKHTKELCDLTISAPLIGNTESLNASCAAAVLMYEKKRQELFDGEQRR